MKTTKIRKAARGQNCTLRLHGCNGNPETTVLCHLDGGGMGRKSEDYYAVFGCSSCHDKLDGRSSCGMTRAEVWAELPRALRETWEILIDIGLIEIK